MTARYMVVPPTKNGYNYWTVVDKDNPVVKQLSFAVITLWAGLPDVCELTCRLCGELNKLNDDKEG